MSDCTAAMMAGRVEGGGEGGREKRKGTERQCHLLFMFLTRVLISPGASVSASSGCKAAVTAPHFSWPRTRTRGD